MQTHFQLTVIQPQISGCTVGADEMTPHKQGAYCNQCNKVVHDLTHLDNRALAKFLEHNNGAAICGKVRNDALLPSMQMSFENQSPEQQKFILFGLALIFVFGPMLFSCNEEQEIPIKAIQQIETIAPESIIETEPEASQEIAKVMKWVECGCTYEEYPDKPEIKDSLFAVDKDGILLDTVVINHNVTKCGQRNNCSYRTTTSGMMSIYSIEIDTTVLNVTPTIDIIEPTPLALAVYPNPAMQDVTITYNIIEPGNAILSIFSLNGQHIVDLINTDDVNIGEYTTGFNVSEIASGIYLVVLTNNDSRQVFRMAVTK